MTTTPTTDAGKRVTALAATAAGDAVVAACINNGHS